MVGIEFLEQVSKLQVASYVGVEDFADKFNFLITVMVIMLCTTTVTVKQYMMKPISCYMATDIGGRNLLDYVENYCWVQGTAPIAYSSRIPDDEESWEEINKKKLLYYQWVPFVLGLQCILFYLPRLIWQMICYNRSGTDVQHLVTSASQAVHSNEEQRNKLVKHLARTLEQMLFQQHREKWIMEQEAREHEAGACSQVQHFQHHDDNIPTFERSLSHRIRCCVKSKLVRCKLRCQIGPNKGMGISSTYFVIKLLYLTNSLGQLFMMESFLGIQITDLLYHTFLGSDWESTLMFPRVGFCIVPIRSLGSESNYATAQCVLPVNMLNEKIYFFLCFWISFVTLLNMWSSLQTLLRFCRTKPDQDLLKKWLRLNDVYDDSQKTKFDEFSIGFLRQDGMFVVRLLKQNAGQMIVDEILSNLWLNFIKRSTDPNLNTRINRRISICENSSKSPESGKELKKNPPIPSAPPEKSQMLELPTNSPLSTALQDRSIINFRFNGSDHNVHVV